MPGNFPVQQLFYDPISYIPQEYLHHHNTGRIIIFRIQQLKVVVLPASELLEFSAI